MVNLVVVNIFYGFNVVVHGYPSIASCTLLSAQSHLRVTVTVYIDLVLIL